MARRFYTVEDLNRDLQRGGEIVLDESTIVTPQAQEAARTAGISLQTPAGAWQEPTPNRGPDADRAQAILPHLPEPHDDDALATSVILTAVGKNRPGVLAEVTQALVPFQVNVHDISQKMMEDYFHLMLVIELPPSVDFDAFKQGIECLGEGSYLVRVMHERVFRFMHRV